jgi:hypothetical protein
VELPDRDETHRPDDDGCDKPDVDPALIESSRKSLNAAVRRARVDAAERTDVLAELRGAEIARLEMLGEALAPVFAAVPADVDLFDTGLARGDHPRLFVDMIAFVDMGRDRRLYRFQQDTRYGRTSLAESERIDVIVEAVTAYVARRMVERDKALSASPATEKVAVPAMAVAVARRPRAVRLLGATFGFLIDLLGTAMLVFLLLAGLWYAGTSLLAWFNGS